VLVLCLCEPELSRVHAAVSAPPTSCVAGYKKIFTEFFNPSTRTPLAPARHAEVNANLKATCPKVSFIQSGIPSWLINPIKQIPAVAFLLQRFHEMPEHKLAFLEQHVGMGLAGDSGVTTSFLELDAGYTTPNGFTLKILPLWVKGDPGSADAVCYSLHFGLYLVSWLFVGAFVSRFVEDAITEIWPVQDALLGRIAFIVQMMYAILILICGYVEEVRSAMNDVSRCLFHKRYIMNFAYAMILGMMWRIALPIQMDLALFPGRQDSKPVLMVGEDVGLSEDVDDMLDGEDFTLERTSDKAHNAADDGKTDKTKEKKEPVITASSGTVMHRMLTHKSVRPFLLAVVASVLSMIFMCDPSTLSG